MSVRIIDKTPDPTVAKQIVCRNCGVTLEYVPKDVIILWKGTDYGGGADGAKGFKCPNCNENVGKKNMKIKIEMEIDVNDLDKFQAKKESHIPYCIDRISYLLQQTENTIIRQITNLTSTPELPGIDKMIESKEKEAIFAKRFFQNLTISGTTGDGKTYYFNHQDAGYKETFLIDGQPRKLDELYYENVNV